MGEPSVKPWLCLGALLVLWAGDARAVDSVLVPLELSGDEWVARFRRALDRVEEGRHGDGIEILQRAVDESLLPLNAARGQGGALVQVPAELPTGFSALRQALLDTWTRDAPEQRAQADDPRAEGGLDAGYELLQERAAMIEDAGLRRSYLENVPHHRELVAAWRASHA